MVRIFHRTVHGPARVTVLLALVAILAACSGPGSDLTTPATSTVPTAPPTIAARTSAAGSFQTPVASEPTATVTIPAPAPASTAPIATSAVPPRAAGSSAAGSASAAAQPPTPAIPPSTGPLQPAYRIAFVSNGPSGDDIWTVDPDGRRLVDLTKGQKTKGNDSEPQWSPDGRRLAFVSDRDGNADIWVMNADGSSPRNLTHAQGEDLNPRWSPDGTRIAFISFRDGDAEVYVMTADGTEQTNVTKADGDDVQPAWSPDGTQIAFVSERGKKPRALYVLTVASPKDPFKVAAPACDMANPAWTPDGKTLVVVACGGADGQGSLDPLRRVVYLVPAGGGSLTATSDPKVDSGGPVFSPDGRSLAFWSYQTPQQADVVVIAVGAGTRRVIQAPPGAAREPAWSVDSASLAFIGGDFTIGNVIVTDAGGVIHNITNHAANDRSPQWSPAKLP